MATPTPSLTREELANLATAVAGQLRPAIAEEVASSRRAELPADVPALATRVEKVYVGSAIEGEQKAFLAMVEQARGVGFARCFGARKVNVPKRGTFNSPWISI